MNWKKPHLWIALMSMVGVFSLAVVDMGRTSPGVLATVHQRIPELADPSGCADCHGGWTTSMQDACLACHEVVADHIDTGIGLHGILGDDLVSRCAQCHSDHHGEGFAIVNKQSFAQAGVPDPDAFDHGLIGFPMDGKHLELECSECHTHAAEPILPEGAQRYIGLESSCLSCHEDSHEGALGTSCTDCHQQTSFEEQHAVGHDEHLPLLGGHAELDCRECHAEDDRRSLEAIFARKKPLAPRSCVDCHDSPHAKRFVSGVAKLVKLEEGASCVACHADEHTSFHGLIDEMPKAWHARSGFRSRCRTTRSAATSATIPSSRSSPIATRAARPTPARRATAIPTTGSSRAVLSPRWAVWAATSASTSIRIPSTWRSTSGRACP